MGTQITRRACLFGLSALGLFSAQGQAQALALPKARALSREIASAADKHQALVVMVSLEGCAFCRMARQTQLLPRMQQGMPVVQVDMRSSVLLKDARDEELTHDALTRRWGVRIAPTLLFLGPQGMELAERMEGAYQPDFYGAYLDERLSQASQRLRERRG